ncbi:MAG: RHS repeat-associated core domain-containing protein [Bryobacteraceae bacterium]
MIGNPSTTTTYNYDGEGRRVQKITTSGTTNYVYDAMGHLAAEYGGSSTSAGRVYLSVDALGSTRLVTDASGNPTEQYDYAPFGEELTQGIDGRVAPYSTNQYPTTPDAVTEKFTGKERDAETGLDYFGARYFSGAQGRFITPDWSEDPYALPYANLSNPQSLNLYAYAQNNPLSRRDEDGHVTCDPDSTTWGPNGVTVTAGACHLDLLDYLRLSKQALQASLRLSQQGTQQFLNNIVNNATLAVLSAIVPPPCGCEDDDKSNQGKSSSGKAAKIERDASGKVHGEIRDLRRSALRMDREELKDAAHELNESIKTREQEQLRLGEDPAHRLRIEEERDLLRTIDKKLSGS